MKLRVLSPPWVGAEVTRAGEEGPGAEVHSAPHLDPRCVSKTQGAGALDLRDLGQFNAIYGASLVAQLVKNLPANAGDLDSIPGSGRPPGGGKGNPLQYSCLGNPWTEELGGLQSMGSQRVGYN